jgi:hypothetical protein
MDGADLVVLLGGASSKKDQQKDIATAQECWRDYKKRKAKE